jgi:acid phosphatase (class A)
VNPARRYAAWSFGAVAVLGLVYLQLPRAPQFLQEPADAFVALFAAPPASDSAATRAELDELLRLQAARTAADVAAAQSDRKTQISRFAEAAGMSPARMEQLQLLPELAEDVEDDIRPYVRAVKEKFRRLRPYVLEPRLEPCIDDVKDDLSYPSGHATWAHVMALVLIDMVPERANQLQARAGEYARQRMVCGVHFGSDVAAGSAGAAWLVEKLSRSDEYRRAAAAARRELRAALGLQAQSVQTSPE